MTRLANTARIGLLSVTALLAGCADDLLGHPGERAPGAADSRWNVATTRLVEDSFADLPTPMVDLAAWPEPPPGNGLAGRLQRAAMLDAGGDEAAASLRRAQRALPREVHAVVSPDMLEAIDTAHWVRRDALPATWVDVGTLDAPLADHVASLPDGAVVLVGCAHSAARAGQCLNLLESRPDTWLTLDGATHRQAVPDTLMLLLQRADLYPQYKWASRWPAPAVNWNIWLRPLVEHGFLAANDVTALRAIYAYNPLAFQVVLLRRLRLPGTRLALPTSIFSGLPVDNGDDA